MLTELDAIKIYEFKLSWMLHPSSTTPMRSLRGQSGPVAKLLQVAVDFFFTQGVVFVHAWVLLAQASAHNLFSGG